MPLALQFGMPLDEFWYGDMRLLEVYRKAYTRKKSYEAWLQGQYNCAGYSVVLANAFAKKGAKKQEYPKWEDPVEKENRPVQTYKDFQKQQEWLFHKKE